MTDRSKILLGIAGVAVLAAAAFLLIPDSSRKDAVGAVAQSKPENAAPAVGQGGKAPAQPHSGSPATTQPVVPHAQRIDQLDALGTPEAKFKAYQLLKDCATLQGYERAAAAAPAGEAGEGVREAMTRGKEALNGACDGLSPSLVLRRIDYLTKAAEALVPGAATAFLNEGPNGDPLSLKYRPADPLVVAWKEKAVDLLTRSGDKGDLSSIATLAQLYDPEPADSTGAMPPVVQRDEAKAVQYWATVFEVKQHLGGQTLSPQTQMRLYEKVGRSLTPEQRSAAIEAGRRYAAECCGVEQNTKKGS